MNDQKGVLRSTTVMFLFVGLFGIWMGGCETQEQKVERLIKQFQDQNENVRQSAAEALGPYFDPSIEGSGCRGSYECGICIREHRSRYKGCGACSDPSIAGSG